MSADAGPPGVEVAQPQPAPLLRIVRGQPTDEELAALVTVVAAAAAGADVADQAPHAGPSPWGRPLLMHRHPIADIGPGAWQHSLR